MLFRPSFCANCGEKIDRAEWGILTSRRFCQVCESEFKGQDLIPRFIVAVSILVGVIGFGGYLKSGSGTTESRLIKQPRKFVDHPVAPAPQVPVDKADKTLTTSGNANHGEPSFSGMQKGPPGSLTDARTQELQRPTKFQPEPVETVYMCGASTLKGTACRRRVKSNVRCFQHVGMPSLLPPDQLRIK